MSQDTPIIINPTLSTEARSFKNIDEVVHQDALQALAGIVGRIYQRIPELDGGEHPSSFSKTRTHETIAVFGQRGAGKSTFLLTAMDLLANGKHPFTGNQDIFHKIQPLGVIDPTMLGNNEHILLTILQRIVACVEDMRQKQSFPGHGLGEDRAYEAWRDELLGLAKGLKIIGEGEDSGKPREFCWDDAQFYLDQHLEATQHGGALEAKFHAFVQQSAKLINKEAFVLALDDVDIKPSTGWHVLEVIRKYLTTPRLMVLLSGDSNLYSLLIRKEQNKAFALQELNQLPEGLRDSYQRDIAALLPSLEEQYLQKIFNPLNQIELPSLGYYLARKKQISIVRGAGRDTDSFSDFIEQLCTQKLYLFRADQRQQVQALLSGLPIRSIIRILEVAYQEEGPHKLDLFKLASVFSTAVHRMGFSLPELENIGSKPALHDLVRNLYRAGVFRQGVHLEADQTDEKHNTALLTLGGLYAEAVGQKPGYALQYMLRAALPQQIFINYFPTRFDELFDYLQTARDQADMHVSRRITGAVRSEIGTNRPMWAGTLQVYSESKRNEASQLFRVLYPEQSAKDKNSDVPQARDVELQNFARITGPSGLQKNLKIKRYVNTVGSLQESIESWHKKCVTLPFVTLLDQGSAYPCASIYHLLGCLSDLVSSQELRQTFDTLSHLRTYPTLRSRDQGREDSHREPPKKKTKPETEAEEVDIINRELFNDWPGIKENFLVLLQTWQAKWETVELKYYPSLYARIANRLFYTLLSIEETLQGKNVYPGTYIHRSLAAFFNAVLVEEALAQGTNKALDPRNPVTSDATLIRNMARAGLLQDAQILGDNAPHISQLEQFAPEMRDITVSKDQMGDDYQEGAPNLPLFQLTFSCPLWGLFLYPPYGNLDQILSSFSLFNQHVLQVQKDCPSGWYTDVLCVSYKGEVQFPNLYTPLQSVPIVRGD